MIPDQLPTELGKDKVLEFLIKWTRLTLLVSQVPQPLSTNINMAELNVSYNGAIARVSLKHFCLHFLKYMSSHIFVLFFCFIFILSAWQPSRLKCWCHDCPHVAPHGLSGLRLASTTGPHIHKSSTTPNASHVKRLGSYKRFPQPLEPSPLVKPFATQCETFSVSLLSICFSWWQIWRHRLWSTSFPAVKYFVKYFEVFSFPARLFSAGSAMGG